MQNEIPKKMTAKKIKPKTSLKKHFAKVKTTKKHKGRIYSVSEAIVIVVLGSICGIRSVMLIHRWASDPKIRKILKRDFAIKNVPSYWWLLCLLKIVQPESLNRCFTQWVRSMLPEDCKDTTVAIDGKSIRSSAKTGGRDDPLHIVSAQLAEHSMTLGQRAANAKSNEIPAVRELLRHLELSGCMVVADAMHCQKETAGAILEAKADYLLCVKNNQKQLFGDIAGYVGDKRLRRGMDKARSLDKTSGRVEQRTAYASCGVSWIPDKNNWSGLACFGAVRRCVTSKNGVSDEWHYYISSRALSARELLKRVRMEWSVETMHWLLDVHFGEDFCRVEDGNILLNLNIARKIAINIVRRYKDVSGSKLPFSGIIQYCMINPDKIRRVVNKATGIAKNISGAE